MANAVTLEEVWSLFKESDRKFRETIEEMRERSAETDRRLQETERRFQEAELRRAQEAAQAELRRAQEAAQRLQEAEQRSKESERLVKDVTRQMGNLTDKWGQFVEGLVAPSCRTLFAKWGIPVHMASQRAKAWLDDGRSMEIDVLVTNTSTAVLVEVKSTMTVAHVQEHLQRLAEFKTFFPRYADYHIIGAMAAIVFHEKSAEFASKQGLFVIAQSGDTVYLTNPPEFTPRKW